MCSSDPADSVQLSALKKALEDFSKSTGLYVNFHKSCMLPINVSDEEIAQLAQSFGCAVGTMPFTYLGLPLGTTRPRIQDLTPLVPSRSSPNLPKNPATRARGKNISNTFTVAVVAWRKKEGCNTRTSQEVTHPSTTLAQARLTSEF